MKTKPRDTVNDRYTLQIAYQDNAMFCVNTIMNDNPFQNLIDIEGGFEKIKGCDDTNLDIDKKDVEEEEVKDDVDKEDFDGNDELKNNSEDHGQYNNLLDGDE